MNFSARQFETALGTFATGVTVITTLDAAGQPVGITANSFNSVSLEPPLILFSLSRTATSLAAFTRHQHFAVNLLRQEQEAMAVRFAERLSDKWAGVEHGRWDSGCPILNGCLASFECELRHTYDGGDHLIFVGQVVKLFSTSEGQPLMYYRGRYSGLKSTP